METKTKDQTIVGVGVVFFLKNELQELYVQGYVGSMDRRDVVCLEKNHHLHLLLSSVQLILSSLSGGSILEGWFCLPAEKCEMVS